jgi:hypothetical protein
MDDAAVAHDDEPGAFPGFGRHRSPAGSGLVARYAELLRRNRPEPIEVEFVDAAVAPDLLFGGGPREVGEPFHGRAPPLGEPVGTG